MTFDMVRYYPSTKDAVAAYPKALRIRGVVFDMDGTLSSPIDKHLHKMRVVIKVPPGHRTLEYVDTCLQGEEREWAHKKLIEIETEALESMQISEGLVPLLRFLHEHSIPIAIITRNNSMAVDYFLKTVVGKLPKEEQRLFAFDPAIDRSFKPAKPAPDAMLYISEKWGIPPEQLLMVGDHGDDLLCGLRAGSVSALLRYEHNTQFENIAHIVVDKIDQLVNQLEHGFEANMTIIA
ncbi:hypothetical protein IW140_000676 [Coemansia sp. RSA 1813]|nr:hypothetical protein EV178_000819 [Coemansia sp. RSA 1646]KAJ1773855.1 hypothetical protein LPJ74_000399 [Coemansia sp. RSA 1843]KAJ2092439.1 hypothetical protein IW138_001201 [Coemansia sp. RSA 986]KAJ2217337.1 hypothetical protein EV179_000487 [Coemansia sp. RSA 487]KAJ2572561.1 hypothetical protein IW140_000676 [Coemansia sp. RSA 1813]